MFGIIYSAFESAVFVCFPTVCFPAGFMKNIRFVLLLGVGIMLAAVVLDFLDSRRTQANVGLKELVAIPSEFSSQSSRWSWSQTSGDSRKIEIFADSVRQTKETLLLELEGVELKIFREDGKSYDQVLSGRAEFDSQSETLYSEGEVILALGLSLDDPASTAKMRRNTSTPSSFDAPPATSPLGSAAAAIPASRQRSQLIEITAASVRRSKSRAKASRKEFAAQ